MVFNRFDEEPDCIRCDNCYGSGTLCEYCGPGTNYPHYCRTEEIEDEPGLESSQCKTS